MTQKKREFSVTIRFSHDEYLVFSDWYNNTCRRGFHSFRFPAVDMVSGGKVMRTYRFAKDTAPSYSNTGGDRIDCVMTWEEVDA